MPPRRGPPQTRVTIVVFALVLVAGIMYLSPRGRHVATMIGKHTPRSGAADPGQQPPASGLQTQLLQSKVDALETENQRLHERLATAQAALDRCREAANTEDTPAPLPPRTPAPLDTPPQTVGASPRAADDGAPWLIIAVPTVPRQREAGSSAPMLMRTLKSIQAQVWAVPTPLGRATRVVVMNNKPGEHKAFDEAKRAFRGQGWIDFLENTAPLPDEPMTTAPEFASKNQEGPTPRVRRQTLDVMALLDAVRGKSRYVLLYEDDFHFCDNALLALDYMIARAHEYEGVNGWSAIRCSFGLNGIVLQNGATQRDHADVAAFRLYLGEHYVRRPPDHLAVEFYAKESRQARKHFGKRRVMAFRYNIARHDGKHSTLREDVAWDTPQCFTELIAPQVFPVEAWNPVDCPRDDMWPCDGKAARPTVLVWNNASEAHVSNNRIIYVDKQRG